ncbi:ATP-binding protein [Streptomyces sp. NPDC127051]|uniref:ATP-binding protein n=1 Tax=Streptomyces sp. NPDC127051 TaxID=3347119 RepID=UPI003666D080
MWTASAHAPTAAVARLPPGVGDFDALAASAVVHGHVPGRNFEVVLRYDGRRVWVEVSDTRGEQRPLEGPAPAGPWSAEGGRGLVVVEAVALEWGVRDRPPGHPGKTVWPCL